MTDEATLEEIEACYAAAELRDLAPGYGKALGKDCIVVGFRDHLDGEAGEIVCVVTSRECATPKDDARADLIAHLPRLLDICREQGARIKALENPWRCVEDELPEDKQDVGFIMHWPGNWNHQRILGGRFHAGRDYPEFSVPGLATEATHWFPMPKMP